MTSLRFGDICFFMFELYLDMILLIKKSAGKYYKNIITHLWLIFRTVKMS